MGRMCEQWSWMWGEKTPSILYKYGLGLPYKISNTCVKLHSSLSSCTFIAVGIDLMVGKIGFSYEPIQAFPTRQGCTPESYELVATFISV